jgi:hypothetical protein
MRFNSAVAILSLCLVANLSVAGTITGKVVGVSDGDTVTVLDSSHVQHKVRLEGSGGRKCIVDATWSQKIIESKKCFLVERGCNF